LKVFAGIHKEHWTVTTNLENTIQFDYIGALASLVMKKIVLGPIQFRKYLNELWLFSGTVPISSCKNHVPWDGKYPLTAVDSAPPPTPSPPLSPHRHCITNKKFEIDTYTHRDQKKNHFVIFFLFLFSFFPDSFKLSRMFCSGQRSLKKFGFIDFLRFLNQKYTFSE